MRTFHRIHIMLFVDHGVLQAIWQELAGQLYTGIILLSSNHE